MIRKPKVFRTFFVKEWPSDEVAVTSTTREQSTKVKSPVINVADDIFSNYLKNTCEQETSPCQEGDFSSDENEFEERTYGIDVVSLRPELHKQFLESDVFLEFNFDLTKSEWEGPEQLGEMKYWSRKDPKYVLFWTEIIIDAPLEEVASKLIDDDFAPRYDKQRQFNNVIRKESSQCSLYNYGICGTWPVSGRDMLIYRLDYFQDQDTFIIQTVPATDFIYPPLKGMVRADLIIQKAILTRLDRNRTKYSNCTMFSPNVS